MFTGIIEAIGEVIGLQKEQGNLHITVRSAISQELKIDQSVAHNGACLTVTRAGDGSHTVTAINETLRKTNLEALKTGDKINLERAMKLGGRLDGHLVQGHIDQTGRCIEIKDEAGSKKYSFSCSPGALVIEKGSVCINGVSLTAFDVKKDQFSVAVIPYTLEHTTFKYLQKGDIVNLEFDMIGKYIERYAEVYRSRM